MRPGVAGLILLWLAGCGSPRPSPKGADVTEPRRINVVETLNCNQLVHYVRPVYPKEARRNRIEGTVTLRARITKAGDLQDITVLKGNPIFVAEAVRVAKQWRYTPCVIDSEPVEVITTLDLNFNLSQ